MKLWLIVAGIASGTAILADLLIVAGGVSGWVRVVASLTASMSFGVVVYWYIVGIWRKPQQRTPHS